MPPQVSMLSEKFIPLDAHFSMSAVISLEGALSLDIELYAWI